MKPSALRWTPVSTWRAKLARCFASTRPEATGYDHDASDNL